VQTREELLKLHARLQTTTVYVTHDQIEAMTMGHRIVVMRSGVVQQVGKPQQVYDHPVNTFVAAFLGSPRINLHTGNLHASGDALAFVSGDTRIPLPYALAAQARSLAAGNEVALGVRPEDISVLVGDASVPGDRVRLSGVAALVEPVGSDLYVNAATGELTWTARTDPRLPIERGAPVTLALDLRHAHLFGPDGRNLAAVP
jgi:multiple sugar transport system ATP-binding protein